MSGRTQRGCTTASWCGCIRSGPTPDIFTGDMLQAAAATDGVDTTADPNVFTLAERALRTARRLAGIQTPGRWRRRRALGRVHTAPRRDGRRPVRSLPAGWLALALADGRSVRHGGGCVGERQPIPSKSGSPIARMLADGGTMLSDGGSILATASSALMALARRAPCECVDAAIRTLLSASASTAAARRRASR